MEHVVWSKIKATLSTPPTYRDNKLVGGDGCASDRTRPDLCWVLDDRIVHVEVDEHSHDDREVSCELKKLDAANYGLAGFGHVHLPTCILRFNCGPYDHRRVGLDERCASLVAIVNCMLITPVACWDPLRANVVYLYYHSNGQKHIDAARAATESLVVQFIVS
jgi:hypothetical protein